MVAANVPESHEYWLSDLARELTMPNATLYKWQRWGWVYSRKVAEASVAWRYGPMRTSWNGCGAYGLTSVSGLNRVIRKP
jgi:hypothetical protein